MLMMYNKKLPSRTVEWALNSSVWHSPQRARVAAGIHASLAGAAHVAWLLKQACAPRHGIRCQRALCMSSPATNVKPTTLMRQ